MFVNQENELALLEKEFASQKSSFTVIYGRRRVGKTALISRFIENKTNIYFYATESSLNSQLESFTKEIAKIADESYASSLKFDSFEAALLFLANIKREQKLIVAIDEYQNICKLDKSFSSVLQKVWDTKLSKSNIHLILCGSVISMMHSEVLDYSAPLYGRRTSNIHLKPLHPAHIKSFVPTLDRLDTMMVYASFGTIPKYLEMYDKNKSFFENVSENILDKNSFLYSEGNFLLRQEIGDVGSYFAILESISKGNTKIGDIAATLSVHSSYLPRYLNKLIELDIIQKETPITETNPLKSKMGRYRIKDKFLNFWFFYVYKNYNLLELGQKRAVMEEIEKNFNDRFVSFAFDDFILEDIILEPKKYLDFVPSKIGRWWNNRDEIDIVAMDEESIAFIECKWQNSVNRESIKKELILKSDAVGHKKRESFLVIGKGDYLGGVI